MFRDQAPHIVVVGGPNGAGKSTVAPVLIREKLGIDQFVNADLIAAGMSPFAPATVSLRAAEVMLHRMNDLAQSRSSFAFETTLASRTHASFLKRHRAMGYIIHLVYIWLETPDLALERVADRVRQGGHDVPAETIRRRYRRGLQNLFSLYTMLADTWIISDNSGKAICFVAEAERNQEPHIYDKVRWSAIQELAS